MPQMSAKLTRISVGLFTGPVLSCGGQTILCAQRIREAVISLCCYFHKDYESLHGFNAREQRQKKTDSDITTLTFGAEYVHVH